MHIPARYPARFLLSAIVCLSFVTAASARPTRTYPSLHGSYFGSFVNQRGDIWQSDLTVAGQSHGKFGGGLNLAAILRNATFTGSCSGDGSFSIVGRSSPGQRTIRLRMKGTCRKDDDTGTITLMGTYSMSGATVEKGSFTLSGGDNHPSF